MTKAVKVIILRSALAWIQYKLLWISRRIMIHKLQHLSLGLWQLLWKSTTYCSSNIIVASTARLSMTIKDSQTSRVLKRLSEDANSKKNKLITRKINLLKFNCRVKHTILMRQVWASPTLVGLHCARRCTCYLFGPSTYPMSVFNYCTHLNVYGDMHLSSKPWKWEERATVDFT